MTRKLFASIAVLTLVAGALAGPAIAGRDGEGGHGHGHGKAHPPATKMRFKLADHQLDVGEAATGGVTLLTRVDKKWGPLAGATLSVELVDFLVDSGECATLTTDAEGHATATCTAAAEGEYVMKVRYAGDETHKKAQRAQGFTVGLDDGDDDDSDEDPDDETPDPLPSVSPTS